MHQNKVIHRNICSERVFIGEGGIIKLDYFGHFVKIDKCSNRHILIYGNISSVSPELLT